MIKLHRFAKAVAVVILLAGCAEEKLPPQTEIFTDPRDGRNYPTVQIGEQLWMAKNLAFVSDSSWCYEDNLADCDENGRLYIWEEACNACPAGWRLATDKDWIQLEAFLGMAAEELESTRFRGTDQGARLRVGGDTGFNAPISGYRRPNGSYDRRGQSSAYWLATDVDSYAAWHRDVRSDTGAIYRSTVPKGYALSARCIKIEEPRE